MTPKKAIEILTQQITGGPTPHPQDYVAALGLGIEALKNYKEMKDMGEIFHLFMLTGETEE